MDPQLTVVAGVIERNGKVLICRRRADARHHPLKWEFPGGKVEPGENPREALVRELDEELGIQAAAGDEMASYHYQYAGRPPIFLVFFRVREYTGEMVHREFEAILWEERERLPQYDFLEGDVAFVRSLANVTSPGL